MEMGITKRQRLEQTLRDNPDLLAGIIASAIDAIIATDDTQRIMLFNAAAERMFACPADEAIGTSIDRFIPKHLGAAPLQARRSLWGVREHTLGATIHWRKNFLSRLRSPRLKLMGRSCLRSLFATSRNASGRKRHCVTERGN